MLDDLQLTPELETAASAREPEAAALKRLRTIVDRAQSRGVRSLSAQDLEALPSLYRYAATRLSRAQTAGANPRRIQELSRLVAAAHGLLYRDSSAPPGSLLARSVDLLLHQCPRTIRGEWRMLTLSLLAFYGLAALSYSAVSRDLELAFTFMDAGSVAEELEQLRATAPGEAFRGNFTFGWEQSAHAAGALMVRNIGVAAMLFGAALLPPVFLLLLVLNGLMVGTYLGVASHWGQALNIGSILMCHGMLELQALALAGAAGLVLARGLFLPGAFTRAQAMRREGSRAWNLFAAIVPMLIAAALIEAYVSPHAGLTIRMLFMCVSALLLVAWIGLGGRKPSG